MIEMHEQINDLIEAELEAADEVHPDFASAHEGYAVMREEFEETMEEIGKRENDLAGMWMAIRGNDGREALKCAWTVEAHARKVIQEAAQLAAMARKYDRGAKQWQT